MTDIKFFQNKNPDAPTEYCDLAAKLYEVLLKNDAFEYDVRIKNFNDTFSFLFPKGKIIIGKASPHYGAKNKSTCYFTFQNGDRYGLIYFSLDLLCSWLQENWDNLVKGT